MMLASRGVPSDIARWRAAGYLFDLKIDGVRCLATIEDGKVQLTSRTGTTLTSQYPEIVEALEAAYPSGRVVIDGEIAVLGDDGFPSWPRTLKRNAQQSKITRWVRELPARFYTFDLLHLHEDMTGWAYANRRQVLEQEAQDWSDPLQSTVITPDGEALWTLVCEHKLEGMIAKRPDSRYSNGRSTDWIKIKRTCTVSALVGGFDPGEGARASTFGCLHLYLIGADGNLVPVGKVGSGFSDRELHEVMQAMHHPPLIVEVEYLDCSPDGQLRQPVFQRIRTDQGVTDCTTDQLT
jgi:bifunctional non-homologous end joining protein LigD